MNISIKKGHPHSLDGYVFEIMNFGQNYALEVFGEQILKILWVPISVENV